MAPELDLVCAICRELFDDPVLARDGYAYCRLCIIRWAKHSPWLSPRTNERIEGTCVLRSDIERGCLAREARLHELRERCRFDGLDEALALGATVRHLDRPLLPAPDCAQLLGRALEAAGCGWEPHPYVLLELAWRGGALAQLPVEVFHRLCRQDRNGVRLPLLSKDVLVALATEGARRLETLSCEAALAAVLAVKAHLVWRAGFGDAVEVPAHRTLHACFVGVYHRDWAQAAPDFLTFTKPAGPGPEARLRVPLVPQDTRGSAEAPLSTGLETCEEPSLTAYYTSEVDVQAENGPGLERLCRGVLPFPDSRGGETDEEDESATAPQPLLVLQRSVVYLPHSFRYHAHAPDPAGRARLLQTLHTLNEALVAYYQESHDGAFSKRARGS